MYLHRGMHQQRAVAAMRGAGDQRDRAATSVVTASAGPEAAGLGPALRGFGLANLEPSRQAAIQAGLGRLRLRPRPVGGRSVFANGVENLLTKQLLTNSQIHYMRLKFRRKVTNRMD